MLPSNFLSLLLSSSQYQINVSEGHSVLAPYTGWDYTEFTALAHIPLRPPNDYYPLSDITASGHSLDGSYINILAIVKSVSQSVCSALSNPHSKFHS